MLPFNGNIIFYYSPGCLKIVIYCTLQLDGLVIEKCVQMGDGQFKEGTWVKISEEFENNPEFPLLSKFLGRYGRLTKRYHGCWCVKWLSHEEAISQALGQRYVSEGPWDLCKLGSEFHGTWLRCNSFVLSDDSANYSLSQQVRDTRRALLPNDFYKARFRTRLTTYLWFLFIMHGTCLSKNWRSPELLAAV